MLKNITPNALNNNNFNNYNFNFKNLSPKQNDEINVYYEMQKRGNKEADKLMATATSIGITTGGVGWLLGKTGDNSYKLGVGAFSLSFMLLSLVKTFKDVKESNKIYKKYENQEEYKNGYDKFINAISIPPVIDFGDEEKNKEYYYLAKKERVRNNKIGIASLGVGLVSSIIAGVGCVVKKVPKKFNVISSAGIVSTGMALAIGYFKSFLDKRKDNIKSIS